MVCSPLTYVHWPVEKIKLGPQWLGVGCLMSVAEKQQQPVQSQLKTGEMGQFYKLAEQLTTDLCLSAGG